MDPHNIPNEYFDHPHMHLDLDRFLIFKMTSDPRLIIGDLRSRFISDPTSDPTGVTSGVTKKKTMDESAFFCPPTKIWLRVVTTTSLGFDSIFCSSTFICNDSFHHFWLVVDEYLPAFFLHCALIINGENHNF